MGQAEGGGRWQFGGCLIFFFHFGIYAVKGSDI